MVGGREGTRGMGSMLVHAEMTGVSGQTGQHNRKFKELFKIWREKKPNIYWQEKPDTHRFWTSAKRMRFDYYGILY